MKTLTSIIASVDSLSEDAVIYAKKPWLQNSVPLVIEFGENDTVTRTIEGGYEYFMESWLIKDLLDQLRESGFSTEKKIEFIIYYATNDAFPMEPE
jgi:hypothetical protein